MYIESSYKQLLFGVSQQDYKDRLDGQNEEQINMISDLTFNLRRRAPLEFLRFMDISTPSANLARYETTVAGARIVLLVSTLTGDVKVLSETGTVLQELTNLYLLAPLKQNIRFATLGDDVYLANTSAKPAVTVTAAKAGYPNPAKAGYFYILSGQFSKAFRLTITNRATAVSYTVEYITPTGSEVGDAALTTPEKIAEELVTAANANANINGAAGLTYLREGGYVYVRSTTFDITISSDSGSAFMQTSNAGIIRELVDLPARLADAANGLIIGVGTGKTPRFYRWQTSTQKWLEDAAYDALSQLENMPVRLVNTAGTWSINNPDWEPRTSGDEDSNPDPHFVESGITGISSFQGRLIILANDYVNMSASNRPVRFYRSTLESLLSNDPIEVASTASQASPYVWATAFNKDLVLWADRYQSIIPGTGAITPANANIAVMNQYETRTSVEPVATGRNVFFAAPRSVGFDAVWEMLPSDFTASQLIGSDVTNHIPRYIRGTCRFLSASATSSILVSGFSGEPNALLVHEYLWSGGEKVHHAWHKWVFDWEVVDAWFVGDKLYMLFRIDNELVYSLLDLRVGAGSDAATTGRLDMFVTATVTAANTVEVDSRLVDAWEDVVAFSVTGAYPYMRQVVQETSRAGGTSVLPVLGAAEGDTFVLGSRFESVVIPTAPSVRDGNGVPITTQRVQLHKYVLSLRNTGEFTFTLSDKYRPEVEVTTSPLTFGSPELDIGEPQLASGQQYIPARLDMPTSRLRIATSDVYDLNITSLEYGFRYNQRYGRRR